MSSPRWPASAGPVLDISDLSIVYRTEAADVRAVRNVSLALNVGEVVGLVGESGSGKSTLAYGACRLLRAPALITGGAVRYRGRRAAEPTDILNLGADELRHLRWREIAIVFQSAMNALNPILNVRDQILDAINAHLRVPKAEALARTETLLDLVAIPRSRLRSYPHELSGGMRQRIMIAMALAAEPEIVIMDEPTTALDVVVQRDILAQIVELKERLGFSILFITHDLSLLLEMADRIAVMYGGQLLEVGTAAEIKGEPAHPYTRGLLRSFPSLHGPRRELAGIPGSPPDLRKASAGCPYLPRCQFGTQACELIDMTLAKVASSTDPAHVTACPFVLPETPEPDTGAKFSEQADREVKLSVTDTLSDSGTPAMEAISLTKNFRLGPGQLIHAVRDVSFGLYSGAVVALVGESGSGKSTVAKLLAGQERPTSGSIRLRGQAVDLSTRKAFRRHKSDVQMVFQDPFASLNPVHTVRYHLSRPIRLHQGKRSAADLAAEVNALLGQVRLTPAEQFAGKYPHELSGGQRQRVSFARALAAQPTVLLADEPVSMLDVSIRLEMLSLLDDLRKRLRLALLYITHDIASARYFADEVLVMYAGQIVERGPAEPLTQQPAHPYTQLLVASAPDPDNLGSTLRTGAVRAGRPPASADAVGQGCPFSPRCPLADDRCRVENPVLQPVDAARSAACWHLPEAVAMFQAAQV